MKLNKIIPSIVFLLVLSSCIETVILGSATTFGVMNSEKSVHDFANDISVKNDLQKRVKMSDQKRIFNDVNIDVMENRIMLTGSITEERYRKVIIKMMWDNKNVKEVIDEILIVEKSEKRNKIKDKLITDQIDTKYKVKRNIKSLNYKVRTVDSTVYILGIAQSIKELSVTARVASQTKGAKKVVSHVILKEDSRREEENSSSDKEIIQGDL